MKSCSFISCVSAAAPSSHSSIVWPLVTFWWVTKKNNSQALEMQLLHLKKGHMTVDNTPLVYLAAAGCGWEWKTACGCVTWFTAVKQHAFELQRWRRPRFTSQQSDVQPWHATRPKQTQRSPPTPARSVMDELSNEGLGSIHHNTAEPTDASRYSCYCALGHIVSFLFYIFSENLNTHTQVCVIFSSINTPGQWCFICRNSDFYDICGNGNVFT